MAARLNLHHDEDTRKRFYVYALFNGVVCEYVGKGSGRRLDVQKRKFGLEGRIIKRIQNEKEAYSYERKMIAELKPTLNKHPGGNGSKATPETKYRKDAFDRLIDKIGTRAYAARILLRINLVNPSLVDQSKIEMFREAAYG